jgi:hypothetical protein
MWTRPGYTPPSQPAPPRVQGERLACFERPKGERLVVTLEEYNGHEFVRLQVWAPGSDGRDWPVKGKCVTVKLREAPLLSEALGKIGGDHRHEPRGPAPGPDDERPQFIDRRRPGRPTQAPCRLPPPSKEPFDEFADGPAHAAG